LSALFPNLDEVDCVFLIDRLDPDIDENLLKLVHHELVFRSATIPIQRTPPYKMESGHEHTYTLYTNQSLITISANYPSNAEIGFPEATARVQDPSFLLYYPVNRRGYRSHSREA